ncbi:1,3-beta-glucanosyltransferase [Mortierella sp. AD032]|nr:1,3-beta-glucanosyltransferase [Mortierella sp. AD032]
MTMRTLRRWRGFRLWTLILIVSTMARFLSANLHSHSRPPVPAPDPNAWHITYGDMSHAEGFLGRDHVTLGGLAGVDIQGGNAGGGRGGLTVQHQELALVTSESANFDDAIDGIMGLAFGALSSSGSTENTGNRNGSGAATKPATKTVFENMMSQGLVNKGVFSFYLGKTSRGGGGEVLFGGWDASRIQEGKELVFTNVTRPKYWQINVENVFVEGKRVDYTVVKTVTYLTPKTPPSPSTDNKGGKRSNIAGIMDTGTTLVIVPFRLANAIHELIPGARMMGQSWAVPCNLGKQTHAATGKVELQIEGARFAIPFEDMVREPVERSGGLADEESPSSFDNNPPSAHKANSVDIEEDNANTGDATKGASMKKSSKDGNEHYCFSGIQPSGSNFMIIGDVFIKNNYVVFDQEHQRVGIAPLRLADTLPSEAPEELDVTDGGDEVKDGKKKKTKKEKEKEKKDRKAKEKKKKDEKDEKDEKKDKKEKREARMRVGWEVMNPSSSEDVVVDDVVEEGYGNVKAMVVAPTSDDEKES